MLCTTHPTFFWQEFLDCYEIIQFYQFMFFTSKFAQFLPLHYINCQNSFIKSALAFFIDLQFCIKHVCLLSRLFPAFYIPAHRKYFWLKFNGCWTCQRMRGHLAMKSPVASPLLEMSSRKLSVCECMCNWSSVLGTQTCRDSLRISQWILVVQKLLLALHANNFLFPVK